MKPFPSVSSSAASWLGALLLMLVAMGCRRSAPSVSSPPSPVTVMHPIKESVTESLDLTGTVSASKSVNLVARVSGFLESVNFADGSYVEPDQLLFVIEPEPYKQQLALNEAVLVQAQAEYERQLDLIRQNATSKSSVEKQLSARDQAKAQVEMAKINLGYTQVKAPFAGRIGARQVDPGNLVGAGSATLLATLEQLRPIYVNFNLNERDALHLRDEMRRLGLGIKAGVGSAPVLVGLNNEVGYPHKGVLDFADNDVSSSTGTIALRAVFTNDDRVMFPGLFARVRIPLGDPKPMLVVPQSSIGSDQQGDYVYVIEPGDVVARRAVDKGPLAANGRAIRSGLTEADRVIVNGLLNARPGERVTVTESPTASPPPKP
ncbi:MAG TPA: efflux RND transporter periplasmic adaptor subunit [Verrucomicrobiota bacterium]|nr:efflux transporter periplasmic adaptor subunit [Verrucomicrobiales bacterium]HRI12471.1 efflux RND transporter periplasmic adaptor subunit [Verrucomicrobiota bacterium]